MDVMLRPIRESDLAATALAEREVGPASSPFDEFGHRGVGSLARAFAVDGLLPKDGASGRLGVVVDGALAGLASWRAVHYGPNEGSRAFNLGLVLFRDMRGKGVGPHALRLLARYLFDHFNVMRLEGSTDIENLVMQRVVERAGFTREGVLRGAQFRIGRHHDLVLYSLLRGEMDDSKR